MTFGCVSHENKLQTDRIRQTCWVTVEKQSYLTPPLSQGCCFGLEMVGGSQQYKSVETLLARCVRHKEEGLLGMDGIQNTPLKKAHG